MPLAYLNNLDTCEISGGSYTSGTIAEDDKAFGYRNYKLVNVPQEWISGRAIRLTINENSDDITFTGICDVLVVAQADNFDCSSVGNCMDLTSDDISPDICNVEGGNVVRGTHNCFAWGYHHAWCGIDSNGNAAVAECDQPFRHVHKIEVQDAPYVYEYTQWTMVVMLGRWGENIFSSWIEK